MINESILRTFLDDEMEIIWESIGDPDRDINQEDFSLGYYRALEDVFNLIDKDI